MTRENSPTGEMLKNLRTKSKLTQTNAAKLIHCSYRSWQQWEKGERKMHPAFWELFKLKVKQAHK